LEVPVGEESKSLDRAAYLYTELTNLNAERNTQIIALGGGVVGDLAGFVAATYLRGVPIIQIPTTLLAQCDSSIGGKVAVNHEQLKNKIGTFYQPKLIISDISTLKTLSSREISNGLAEVIKYGIILDVPFYEFLEEHIEKILSLDITTIEQIVTKSVENKVRIIEQDEFDLGIRNTLNYGHTIGHAIESNSNMTIWHGEAIALGMIVEAKLANNLGMLSESEVHRITKIISAAGLPTEIRIQYLDRFFELMQHDKKVNQGKIKFVLPQGLGKAVMVEDIPFEKLKDVLEY
jgi:3-dehydroquinate synthase